MSSTIFAMKTISKTLGKMHESRMKLNYKDYRTLTDTLKESYSILQNQKIDDKIRVFLDLLKYKLETESENLSNIAEETINKDKIREHHDCVLAYSKIDNLLMNLSWKGNSENSSTAIGSKMSSENLIDYNGEHLILSKSKENADYLVLSKFNLDSEYIKRSGMKRIEYTHPTKLISTSNYECLSGFNGFSAIVLHVDKEITLDQFITYVYPAVNKFPFVNFI